MNRMNAFSSLRRRMGWPWSVLAALAALTVAPPTTQAAPQTFNTALPVATGEFIVREQFLYKSMGDDPGPMDRDVEVLGAVSVLGYGATFRLALFGALPFLGKALKVALPTGERVARDTAGFADARVFGRYTLFQRDRRGSNFRIAPFAGLELPTGDDDDTDRLGLLPPPLQLGSGSWDPFAGLAATYQALGYQVDAQVAYKANTEANDFEFGDALRLDASVQYRLWPRELGTGVPGFLYAGLEANYLHQGRNRAAGVDDPDSGGETLFISPGLQYVTKRWVLEAIVQAPAVQDKNGAALEDDVTVRAGFRLNF